MSTSRAVRLLCQFLWTFHGTAPTIAECMRWVIGGVQDMSVVPGVRIEDMGHKMGCNGVDNGKLWFDRELSPD